MLHLNNIAAELNEDPSAFGRGRGAATTGHGARPATADPEASGSIVELADMGGSPMLGSGTIVRLQRDGINATVTDLGPGPNPTCNEMAVRWPLFADQVSSLQLCGDGAFPLALMLECVVPGTTAAYEERLVTVCYVAGKVTVTSPDMPVDDDDDDDDNERSLLPESSTRVVEFDLQLHAVIVDGHVRRAQAIFGDDTTSGPAGDTRSARSAGGDAGATCVVCFSRPSAVILIPCAHFDLCAECAGRLTQCPACRADITHVVHVE
jgi:hypothetical protein